MTLTSSRIYLVLLGAMLCSLNTASAAPISGTISLPTGQMASGSMLINISARDISGGGQPFNFTNVSIPAGGSTANFSLDSIPDDPTATWQIKYGCFQNFVACRDFVMSAFYDTSSPGNVSYKEEDATTVLQGTSNVNITFLEGIKFSGSLSTPVNPAPAGDIDTQLFFTTPDFSVSETVRYTIPEGDSSFDFSVAMPMDVSLNYVVRYQCDPTTSSSGVCSSLFLTNGFFQSSVEGNAVSSAGAAELLAGNVSHSNIDMTLIPGASISGIVSRIAGTSTSNPVAMSIIALDQTAGESNAFTSIEIPAGMSSIPYNLVVTPNAASTWQLRLACNSFLTNDGCVDYGRFSYYDADTPVTFTTADVTAADSLAGNTTHTDINMTPVGLKTISGVIMLPDGVIAPSGGMEFFVSAQEFTGGTGGSNFDSVTITIPEGGISASYAVPIADIEDAEWLLSVNCNRVATPIGCLETVPSVTYYDLDNSPNFTTLNIKEADLLSSPKNIVGVNLILIPAEAVTGVITLGNNRVAPGGGLVVRITARGFNAGIQEGIAFELITVPSGLNEVAYSISLPDQGLEGWSLEFECATNNPEANCQGYKPSSYYSLGGSPNTTTENPALATLLDASVPNNNINITLLADANDICVPIRTANGSIALICL